MPARVTRATFVVEVVEDDVGDAYEGVKALRVYRKQRAETRNKRVGTVFAFILPDDSLVGR